LNMKEWLVWKKSTELSFSACCYIADKAYPFGLCKECWIKEGKPIASKVL